jgi:hypothetical protein
VDQKNGVYSNPSNNPTVFTTVLLLSRIAGMILDYCFHPPAWPCALFLALRGFTRRAKIIITVLNCREEGLLRIPTPAGGSIVRDISSTQC